MGSAPYTYHKHDWKKIERNPTSKRAAERPLTGEVLLLRPRTSTRKVAHTVKLQGRLLIYQHQHHGEPVQPELHLGDVVSLESEVKAGGAGPRHPDVDHHVLTVLSH